MIKREMTGTTGSSFKVLAVTKYGAVGYREYEPGSFRIRVVPADLSPKSAAMLSDQDGWKQPNHSNSRTIRYSKCCHERHEQLPEIVGIALKAIRSRAKNPFATAATE
jgi:hypothetical protein